MMEAISEILEASSILTEEVATASETNLKSSLIQKYISERMHSSKILNLAFKSGLDWINCSKPLSFSKELKGKLVILDFFTYCCINCMHILPQLKSLEREFSAQDGLVVIGVHSPKFPNEHSTLNVKSAVKRYDITHPVVNDPEEHLWTELGICCWPTLVIIGPGGELLLYLLGESHEDLLHMFVRESLSLLKQQGKISSHTIPEVGVDQFTRAGPLSFPGKLCVSKTPSGHELAIADTGHHRVLVLDHTGEVQHIIGGDESGFKDGSFTEARFHAPQGLAFLDPNTLFVADTENHALRKVNLAAGTVVTVAGDGVQGDDMVGGGVGGAQRLSSPWDVIPLNVSMLLVAMAGSHQLWAYILQDTTFWRNKQYTAESCVAVAGSGREENRNNAYPQSAGFAQPSGLALAPGRDTVYVADSESSTIRAVSVTDGRVSALVGGTLDPQNLFAYGDVDGSGQVAKLQHPLAVAWSEHKQALYLCDSYNHKLKVINVDSKNCSTLGGSTFQLNEPGGLCAVDNLLYVADTNNHCVKVINLDDLSFKTMQISFKDNEQKVKNKIIKPVKEAEVAIHSDGGVLELSVSVQFAANAGCKPVPESPAIWALPLPEGWQETQHEDFPERVTKKWFVSVPKSESETRNELMPSCRVFFCQNNLCSARTLPFQVTVIFDDKAPTSVSSHIDYSFTPQ